MAQIAVTLEEIQHKDQRKHIYATPISTTIGIGDSYTITPNGTGATILDNLAHTEFNVSESVSGISTLIAAAIEVEVTNEADVNVTNNPLNVTTSVETDYMKEIASGDIANTFSVNKFGENPLVSSGTTEDVWDGGGTYVFPTTVDITHISQDANQAALSLGTIEVQGLDSNWDLVVQTKALGANTSTPVALDTPLRRVFRMKVLEDVVCTSPIVAHNAGDSQDYSIISTGNNQTLMAIYTVPAGYTAYMTNYFASVTEATGKEPKATEFRLWVADRGGGYEFQIKHSTGIPKAGSGFRHEFKPYFKITEKSDIKVSALPANENANVHSGFDLIVESNA